MSQCPEMLLLIFFCRWSIWYNFWVGNSLHTRGRGEDYFLCLLEAPCSMAALRGHQIPVSGAGDSHLGWALKRRGLLRSKRGNKELKWSAPAFTSELCQRAAAGCSAPLRGTIVHQPSASIRFMCQLLFEDLTWFILQQTPPKPT